MTTLISYNLLNCQQLQQLLSTISKAPFQDMHGKPETVMSESDNRPQYSQERIESYGQGSM